MTFEKKAEPSTDHVIGAIGHPVLIDGFKVDLFNIGEVTVFLWTAELAGEPEEGDQADRKDAEKEGEPLHAGVSVSARIQSQTCRTAPKPPF